MAREEGPPEAPEPTALCRASPSLPVASSALPAAPRAPSTVVAPAALPAPAPEHGGDELRGVRREGRRGIWRGPLLLKGDLRYVCD